MRKRDLKKGADLVSTVFCREKASNALQYPETGCGYGNYAPTNSASAYLKRKRKSELIFRGQLNILQLSILTPHIKISSCSQ
jgi:hypothetical protein